MLIRLSQVLSSITVARITLLSCLESAVIILITYCLLNSAQAEVKLDAHYYGSFGIVKADSFDRDQLQTDGSIVHDVVTNEYDYKPITRFGIQSSLQFSDKVTFTIQGVTAPSTTPNPSLEWAYFRYDITPDLRIRLGKQRKPLYKYSDYINLSNAFLWPKAPEIIYLISNAFSSGNDTINAFYQGIYKDYLYSIETYYNPYTSGKDNYFDISSTYLSKHSFGTVLNVETENLELRLSMHQLIMSYQLPAAKTISSAFTTLGYTQLAEDVNINKRRTNFNSIGMTYLINNWSIIGEIIDFGLVNSPIADNTSAYLSLQNELNRFTWGITLGRSVSSGGNKTNVIEKINNAIEELEDESTLTSTIIIEQLNDIKNAIEPLIPADYKKSTILSLSGSYRIRPNLAIKAHIEISREDRDIYEYEKLYLTSDFYF